MRMRKYPTELIESLKDKARQLRCHIVKMITRAGSGHPGGSLSATDMITALYFHKLRHDPANPDWEDRDRMLFSKGHAAPLWYAALGECGYFPVSEFTRLRECGGMLQGHPDMLKTPGVNMSSGSLGQGLSIANGMALAGRIDEKDYRVYVLLGDGEIQEGQIWEAAMAASHYSLDNLCAILDFNGLQIDGRLQEVMNPEPIPEKWRAFGWNVIEIDGHDMVQILSAYDAAEEVKGMPTIIIGKTVKGKGVSFMEHSKEFHGRAPTEEECEQALKELGCG